MMNCPPYKKKTTQESFWPLDYKLYKGKQIPQTKDITFFKTSVELQEQKNPTNIYYDKTC